MNLKRMLVAVAVPVVATLAGVVGLASPASAASDLTFQASASCTLDTGRASGSFIVTSHRDGTGEVTSFTVDAPQGVSVQDGANDTIGGNRTASAQFTGDVSTGHTTISMSITVTWPGGASDGSDLVETGTASVKIGPCTPQPHAKLTSECDGSVQVYLSNGAGNSSDIGTVGGEPTFEIDGAGGWVDAAISVEGWREGSTVDVPASAAASVTVLVQDDMDSPQRLLVQGGYVAKRGCAGYTAPATTKAASPGATGGKPASPGGPGGGPSSATPTGLATAGTVPGSPAPQAAGSAVPVALSSSEVTSAGASSEVGLGHALEYGGLAVLVLAAAAGGWLALRRGGPLAR